MIEAIDTSFAGGVEGKVRAELAIESSICLCAVIAVAYREVVIGASTGLIKKSKSAIRAEAC
jgi:hypothetical protein